MFPAPGGNLPGCNRNTSGAGTVQAPVIGTDGLSSPGPHSQKMSLRPHVIRDILCYTVSNNVTCDAVTEAADESMTLRYNKEKEQPANTIMRRSSSPGQASFPSVASFPRKTTPFSAADET
jgi:hypothetical protein